MLQRWFGGSQGSWGHEKTQKAFLAGVISRGAPQWTLKGYFLYYYIIARDISSAERAIILPRSERVSQGFSCQYPERPCTTQGSQRRMLHRKIPESMGTAWTVRPFGSYKFWIQCRIWNQPSTYASFFSPVFYSIIYLGWFLQVLPKL